MSDEREDRAQTVLARLSEQDGVCGSEPPRGEQWGDCWCTLPPGHPEDQLCICEICAARSGAPGWKVRT